MPNLPRGDGKRDDREAELEAVMRYCEQRDPASENSYLLAFRNRGSSMSRSLNMPLGNWMWLRPKPFCVLAFLLALGSVELRSNTVAAQSAATLTKVCLKLYKSWQKQESYGAFAASASGHRPWFTLCDTEGSA